MTPKNGMLNFGTFEKRTPGIEPGPYWWRARQSSYHCNKPAPLHSYWDTYFVVYYVMYVRYLQSLTYFLFSRIQPYLLRNSMLSFRRQQTFLSDHLLYLFSRQICHCYKENFYNVPRWRNRLHRSICGNMKIF